MKRLFCILLCMICLSSCAFAEDADNGFSFDEKGFLVGCEDGAEYIFEDEENGVWKYATDSLAITVERTRDTKKIKKKDRILEYFVADIQASPESPLIPIMTDANKANPAGVKQVSPDILAKKYQSVFAVSDDMYGLRRSKKNGQYRYSYRGVVIRNGEIMCEKTRNSKKNRPWPNLDTLALYADGSMKTCICDAYTPEEYLEQGAQQVFAFGPILISEGEVNPTVLDPKYYPYNEPRVAIGMIEPYHYYVILVRGRPDSKYAGVHLDWLAQKMLDAGCTEALNLDGGETATMLFMGKVIGSGGDALRSQGSLITFGTSDQVEQ